MVDYNKSPRDSAFQRFQSQALGAQKATKKKRLSYGDVQSNVADEREDRVAKTDKRLKSNTENTKEEVAKAVDTSAWQAPTQKKVSSGGVKATPSIAPTTPPNKDVSQQEATQSARDLEGDYRSKLVKETESRMTEAEKRYEDSAEKLRKAEESLAEQLRNESQSNVTDVGQQAATEARAEAINRMLAQGEGNVGALGAMNQYNVNYDPRFAALESMGQQGTLNLAREDAGIATARDEAAREAQVRSRESYLEGLRKLQEEAGETFGTRQDEMAKQAESERASLDEERQKYLSEDYVDQDIANIRDYGEKSVEAKEKIEDLKKQRASLAETLKEHYAGFTLEDIEAGGPEKADELIRNYKKQMEGLKNRDHPMIEDAIRSGYDGRYLQRLIDNSLRKYEILVDRLGAAKRYVRERAKADEGASMSYDEYVQNKRRQDDRRKALSRITGGI